MNVKVNLENILLVLIIVISISTFQFWEYVKVNYCYSIFYQGIAVSMFLMSLIILRKSDKKHFSFFICFIMMSNVIDEFILDPLVYGLHEKIFTLLAASLSYKIYIKNVRKNTKCGNK